MHFDTTIIPGILNDSKPTGKLIRRLPYTVYASTYNFDIYGVMGQPLQFSDEDIVPK